MALKVFMEFEEIKKYLPQRYPFLMLDKVLEFIRGEKIIALKNVSSNEPYFVGHFPERAVMPGALIMEAMAQSSILLFSLSKEDHLKEKNLFLFAGAKGKFLKPVLPGDSLILVVDVIKMFSTAAIVKAIAKVNEEIVCKAELTFSMVPLEDKME